MKGPANPGAIEAAVNRIRADGFLIEIWTMGYRMSGRGADDLKDAAERLSALVKAKVVVAKPEEVRDAA